MVVMVEMVMVMMVEVVVMVAVVVMVVVVIRAVSPTLSSYKLKVTAWCYIDAVAPFLPPSLLQVCNHKFWLRGRG